MSSSINPLRPRLFGYATLFRARLESDRFEPVAVEAEDEARGLAHGLAEYVGLTADTPPASAIDPQEWGVSVPFGRCGLDDRPHEHVRVLGTDEAWCDRLDLDGAITTTPISEGECATFRPGFVQRIRARPKQGRRVLVAFQTEDHTPLSGHAAAWAAPGAEVPDEAGERAAALLDDVGLGDAMERRIRTYSRGMRQKAKFARAIAHDPNLLVLDEPFQGTDPTTRRLLMELIRSWANAGRTILLSSHILHDVEALTDRIVFLSGGQVLAVGDRHAIQKLMPHVRQKVRLTPADAGQRPQLARLLLEQPSVEGVSLQRDWVEVDTTDAETFHRALPPLLRKAKIAIHAIDSPGEDLEALYEKLVGGEQWKA